MSDLQFWILARAEAAVGFGAALFGLCLHPHNINPRALLFGQRVFGVGMVLCILIFFLAWWQKHKLEASQ